MMLKVTMAVWTLSLAAAALCVNAQGEPNARVLAARDVQLRDRSEQTVAVKNCLRLIGGCQLPDGGIRMKANGDPVWISPYVANFAALALLAGKEREDVGRAALWLQWYAKNQRPDGTINDFEGGLRGGYHDNGHRDSVDAYAATYLIVADRYYRVTKQLPPGVLQAAKKAVEAIQSISDTDGLTWAKPDYRVKFLMDNVEVYGGLASAERLFTTLDQREWAARVRQMREALGKRLPTFWQKSERLFAYALRDNGVFVVHPENAAQRRASEGLANLYGLAWISGNDRAPWRHVRREFKPDSGNAPEAPVEYWFMAALGVGVPEAKDLRRQTVAEANGFTRDNVYVQRPAVTALALLEGSAWLPSIATPDFRS